MTNFEDELVSLLRLITWFYSNGSPKNFHHNDSHALHTNTTC